MQQLSHDLRLALRGFHRSPGFTVTVIAALTIGIGVNTAIFSVLDTVLLNRLPYPQLDTLVAVENTTHGRAYGPWASPVKYMYWRGQTDVFSDVAAINPYPLHLNYTGDNGPQQLTVSRVSESYFRVLRAPVVHGRPFTAEEDRPGGPKVAVISYDFWRRRMGGANVVGTNLPLSGDSYMIVGILARGFDADPYFDAASAGGQPDLLVPFQLDPNTRIEANSFVDIARLKPGVTLAQAQARIAASAGAFRQLFPTSLPKTAGFTVLRAQEAMTTMFGDPRTRLWVLLGAVGFVLLIACANVANLLLARATGRAHEIAIRSTLGAGRGRILRELLTESLLLALVGGVLGLLAGFVSIRALLAINTAQFPRLGAGGSLVSMDWRVVAFTLGLSLTTGLMFGLVPALAGSRTDLNAVIKASGSRSGGGFRHTKTRCVLVTMEVALAVTLLIGAALLIRTSLALGAVDPGFNPSHVLSMRATFTGSRFQSAPSVAKAVRTGLERARSMPGVESAAATCCLPLQGAAGISFGFVGRAQGPATGGADYVTASDSYFAALDVPVIRGRAFTARDGAGAPPVAIINETMAKRYWTNGRDPLEDRIVVGEGIKELGGGPERRIVGIVGDVRYRGLAQDLRPTIYVPLGQVAPPLYALIANGGADISFVVRTRDDSAAAAQAIQQTVRQAMGLPVVAVAPMERVIANSVSRQRLNMLLMSIFGGAALLLAAIGIYGLIGYSVQQRVQEIGIRIALGAEAERVKRMVMWEGTLLIAIGIAAGLLGAFYTADVLASWLFGVKPRDPEVFVAVPLLLALIALVSVWVPARRASRINPLEALRYQ